MSKFIFCFYDLKYTREFLKSWVSLCSFLFTKNIQFLVTQGDSCNAFYAKQMCLGGSVLNGLNQKPFQSKVDYEYLVFLSGNIAFSVKDFVNLYNKCASNKLPFLSANIENRNTNIRESKNGISIVDHVEFDMTIIRKGVIEKLTYPWFKPHTPKNSIEMNFVDVDICNRIKHEAIVDLYVCNEVNLKRGVTTYE